ncbi:MAG: RNA methyltransferase PUA domain-containing protein, partial [Pseudomonadota bacterium]
MRIPRLFCPQTITANAVLKLDDEAARHASRVLRLRAGAKVVLFDGSGLEYPATLTEVSKST